MHPVLAGCTQYQLDVPSTSCMDAPRTTWMSVGCNSDYKAMAKKKSLFAVTYTTIFLQC